MHSFCILSFIAIINDLTKLLRIIALLSSVVFFNCDYPISALFFSKNLVDIVCCLVCCSRSLGTFNFGTLGYFVTEALKCYYQSEFCVALF